MHELSLAISVMKIVEQESSKTPYSDIKSIEIEVGAISGVEIQAFSFSMNSVMRSSRFPNAKIDITIIEAISECSECNTRFTPISRHEACPNCHSILTTLHSGTEFRLIAISYTE